MLKTVLDENTHLKSELTKLKELLLVYLNPHGAVKGKSPTSDDALDKPIEVEQSYLQSKCLKKLKSILDEDTHLKFELTEIKELVLVNINPDGSGKGKSPTMHDDLDKPIEAEEFVFESFKRGSTDDENERLPVDLRFLDNDCTFSGRFTSSLITTTIDRVTSILRSN